MYQTLRVAPPVDGDRPTPPAVAIFLFENGAGLPAGYARLDEALGGTLSRARTRPEFRPSRGAVHTLYPPHGPDRLLVVGLGKPDRFDGNVLRSGVGKLIRTASAAGIDRVELRVLEGLGGRLSQPLAGRAVADAIALAGVEFSAFHGSVKKAADADAGARELLLDVDDALRAHVEQGLLAGRGLTTARLLAATPPNVANPAYIEAQCRRIAEEVGLTIRVIDAAEAERLGMGGLTAVGRAAAVPPRLIVLEWNPQPPEPSEPAQDSGRGTQGSAPLLFVGKTITFDTGGLSLKPREGMVNMKYDKCGGMAVIGAMEAIARLKLPRRVVGLLPCAENAVDERAFRVDDILTFCNGVTSEITNTDAEGRLVLADALAWGTREYRPSAVVDIATLTGGVVIALGSSAAGLWVNHEGLRAKLADASSFTGEKTWELPLWEEHRDLMKGSHADLINSGERKAHPIQGAAFLSYFVGEDAPKRLPTIPWAHLDIAGVDSVEKETELYDKGPTGYGVRLLTRLAETW